MLNRSKDDFILSILKSMTLSEKIGQMSQLCGHEGNIPADLRQAIQEGKVGSVLNEVCPNTINELQRIARHESRLGIPLLIGRDVIHGFKTIFPIPLGQAASWSPELVESAARVAAKEAASVGINWTFAPMIDISRDPRWGRVAESLGEDPYLCSTLTTSMVLGFQTQDLSDITAIAACAKHFAGYGAVESGRDYSTTNIPENELRNVYFRPFKKAVDSGIMTLMTSFSDLNGIPATGNQWLLDDILRDEWEFTGIVVSDWDSIRQLSTHGFTENDKESAFEASNATVDMEMASTTYRDNLEQLVDEGRIQIQQIDEAVARILSVKYKLGLFDDAQFQFKRLPVDLPTEHLRLAKESALKSCVLLKNDNNILPLNANSINRIAVIGPLADDGYEQLGTWIFDGEERHSISCLQAIKHMAGSQLDVLYEKALNTTRSHDTGDIPKAVEAAKQSDAAILVVGEESILSGEAHCRAELDLPGKQNELIRAIKETGTPVVLVVLAGRPLTIENILPSVDAVLYGWHPGTMGGPAIADLLFGVESPSGKLPITFVRKVGQIPLYYSQKPSGKPASESNYVHMDDINVRAPQTSLGMAATHLDTHFSPLFPFGFGLSYSQFEYQHISVSANRFKMGDEISICANVHNCGNREAEEVVQLYIRDLVASVTRPVKELKGFQRVRLAKGEMRTIKFNLTSADLGFYDRSMKFCTEEGHFRAWIGGNSDAELHTEFEINHA